MFNPRNTLEHKTPQHSADDMALVYGRLKETGLLTEKNQNLMRHYAKYASDITLALVKLNRARLANQTNLNALIRHREFLKEILAALAQQSVTRQSEFNQLLITITWNSFENFSDRPKQYINSRIKSNPNALATYCYQKLNDTKPNKIAFSVSRRWDSNNHNAWLQLFHLWQDQHFLLTGYFTPTSTWDDDIGLKIVGFLKSNNPSNFPPALLHNLKIKVLFAQEQVQRALALTQQSNLHLNLFEEKYDNAQLPGVNFANVNLAETSMTRANLQNARFNAAILHEAILRGADLRGADFTDAQLHHADLRDTILDEKSAQGIINFIENNPHYIPTEYLPLYQCILQADKKNVSQRVQDCIALLIVIRSIGNFHIENFPEAMKDYPVSQEFLKKFLAVTTRKPTAPENLTYRVRQVNQDFDRYDRDYYTTIPCVTGEKLMRSVHGPFYYFFNEEKNHKTREKNVFVRAFMVRSRYLVFEFKEKKPMIWDRNAPAEESPLVSLSYVEEEKNPLLPLYNLISRPYDKDYLINKTFLDAAYLNSDEIVALHRQEVRHYEHQLTVQFFKKGKLVQSYPLAKANCCIAIASLTPDQFAIAYFDHSIEIWERKSAAADSLDFAPVRQFSVEPINRPFCPEKIETPEQHNIHRCHRLIHHYDAYNHAFVRSQVFITPWQRNADNFGLHKLNAEDVLFIQNSIDYQLIVKLNIKTQEVTHAIEFIKNVSDWITLPQTYYPLADGHTFLVGSYKLDVGHRSGPALVLDADTLSFYKTNGVDFDSADEVVSVLESSETIRTELHSGYLRDRCIWITNPLPHITAYHEKSKPYIASSINEQL